MLTSQLRKIVIPIVIFLFALSLISASLHTSEKMSFFEALVVGVTAPVQKVVGAVITGIGSVWKGYFHLVGLQRENEALKRELEELKLELNKSREENLKLCSSNVNLKSMVSLFK